MVGVWYTKPLPFTPDLVEQILVHLQKNVQTRCFRQRQKIAFAHSSSDERL